MKDQYFKAHDLFDSENNRKPLTPGPPVHLHAESRFLSVVALRALCGPAVGVALARGEVR